jgi:hypothetical protein
MDYLHPFFHLRENLYRKVWHLCHLLLYLLFLH